MSLFGSDDGWNTTDTITALCFVTLMVALLVTWYL